MLTMCPHCGCNLNQPLLNGLSTCLNCRRPFDSSRRNLLLSTAWLIRKKNVCAAEYLMDHFGLTEDDANFVIEYVDDSGYSHEEFLKIVNERLSVKAS